MGKILIKGMQCVLDKVPRKERVCLVLFDRHFQVKRNNDMDGMILNSFSKLGSRNMAPVKSIYQKVNE